MNLAPAAWGLVSGLVFALGLVLSGMTSPDRVLAFLDVAGNWDPRLMLVMLGAIAVHFTWLRLAPRAQGPAARVSTLPPPPRLDRALVAGSMLFGVGWGLSGYCPGPALVGAGHGNREALWFAGAMLVGMIAHRVLPQLVKPKRADEPELVEGFSN